MTSRLVWLLLIVVGCGDKSGGGASASASTPAEPSCSETLPQGDRERRCIAGEALCCTAMMSNVPKSAPDYWDKLALACRGGAETSCEIVRDADRDPLYKLDALAQGCTMIGRWPCRLSVMLSLVIAPDRAPAVLENYCRQTDDVSFRFAKLEVDCKKVDAAALAPLKPDADACRGGDPGACKRLAGVDGAAFILYKDIAWGARGLKPDDVEADRVSNLPLEGAAPGGRLRIAAKKGDEADQKAVVAGLEKNVDQLRKCITAAIELDDPVAGTLRLDLLLDKTGRVATTKVVDKDLESQTLSRCLRGEIEDLTLVDPGGAVRSVEVAITPSK